MSRSKEQLFALIRANSASNEVTEYFNDLMVEYGLISLNPFTKQQFSGETKAKWTRIKADGVFDFALDLVDPHTCPYAQSFAFFYSSIYFISLCIHAWKEVDDFSPVIKKIFKDRMPRTLGWFRSRLLGCTDWTDPGIGGATRMGIVSIIDYMRETFERDLATMQKFVDNHLVEMVQLFFIHPLPNVDYATDEALVQKGLSIIQQLTGYDAPYTDEENRCFRHRFQWTLHLSKEGLAYCERTGSAVIIARVEELLQRPSMSQGTMLLATLGLLDGSLFPINKWMSDVVESTVLNLFVARYWDVLKTQPSADDGNVMSFILLVDLNAGLRMTHCSNTGDFQKASLDASRRLMHDENVFLFLNRLIVTLAQCREARELDMWERVTVAVYGCPKCNVYYGVEMYQPAQDLLRTHWLQTLSFLQSLPVQNDCRTLAIKLWQDFPTILRMDGEDLETERLQRNQELQNGQSGCGWYMCPLNGIGNWKDPLECKRCRKAFYCSPFCQEM